MVEKLRADPSKWLLVAVAIATILNSFGHDVFGAGRNDQELRASVTYQTTEIARLVAEVKSVKEQLASFPTQALRVEQLERAIGELRQTDRETGQKIEELKQMAIEAREKINRLEQVPVRQTR